MTAPSQAATPGAMTPEERLRQTCCDSCPRGKCMMEDADKGRCDHVGQMVEQQRKAVNEKPEEADQRLKAAIEHLERPPEISGQAYCLRTLDLVRRDVRSLKLPSPEKDGTDKERMFPVQDGDWIPWSVAEQVYEVYSHCHGTSQSLERLAERHGFGTKEVEVFLRVRQQPRARWQKLVSEGFARPPTSPEKPEKEEKKC